MDKEAGIPGAAEGPSRRRSMEEPVCSLWLGSWRQYGFPQEQAGQQSAGVAQRRPVTHRSSTTAFTSAAGQDARKLSLLWPGL